MLRIVDLLLGKERHGKKIAVKKIQSLDKTIPCIALEKERQKFEQEKKELRDKLSDDVPLEEVMITIDDLVSKVERYLRVQEDEDYSRIKQYLLTKDIAGENEIMEICDISDREIVFKYLQAEKQILSNEMLGKIIEKISSVGNILKRTETAVSGKEDVEELRRVWSYIIKEDKDKLKDLKNRIDNFELNKISEIAAIEKQTSYLDERFACLERYAKDYLSEQALSTITNEVKDYMPREDITYEDIYNGLGDPIVTGLKDCIEGNNQGKMIRESIAKLIYGRLKKGMFVR